MNKHKINEVELKKILSEYLNISIESINRITMDQNTGYNLFVYINKQ